MYAQAAQLFQVGLVHVSTGAVKKRSSQPGLSGKAAPYVGFIDHC